MFEDAQSLLSALQLLVLNMFDAIVPNYFQTTMYVHTFSCANICKGLQTWLSWAFSGIPLFEALIKTFPEYTVLKIVVLFHILPVFLQVGFNNAISTPIKFYTFRYINVFPCEFSSCDNKNKTEFYPTQIRFSRSSKDTKNLFPKTFPKSPFWFRMN